MPDQTPRRERVVLSQRRGARPVRTRVEVTEQTGVGEHLVRGLVRAQLGLALRIGLGVIAVFAVIPLLGHFVSGFATAELAGVPVNWVVLILLPYPLLYLAGRLYIRFAEQAERDFLKVVDDDGGPGSDGDAADSDRGASDLRDSRPDARGRSGRDRR